MQVLCNRNSRDSTKRHLARAIMTFAGRDQSRRPEEHEPQHSNIEEPFAQFLFLPARSTPGDPSRQDDSFWTGLQHQLLIFDSRRFHIFIPRKLRNVNNSARALNVLFSNEND